MAAGGPTSPRQTPTDLRRAGGVQHEDMRDWLEQVDALGELRVLEGVDWQENIGRIAESFLKRLDSIGLVVFHADNCPRRPHGLHRDAGSVQHLARLLHHHAMVGGEVGLALAAVDHDGVHRLSSGQLHFDVSREGRTAESHD